MAVYPIETIGADVLRKKAAPVERVTKKTAKLAADMLETMQAAEGVGLAAPQIGVSERIIVMDIGEGPHILINPEIVQGEGTAIEVEGCLSIPERRGYVKRWDQVTVEALNEKGRPVRLAAAGWLARVIQHEVDHLNGVLFTDKLLEPPESGEQQAAVSRGESS